MKELMQQYANALAKIDQDSQQAERQVIQEFPHDQDGPGTEGIHTSIYYYWHVCTLLTERRAKLKEIEDIAKEKREKLNTKFTFTIQLLTDAYDRWLMDIQCLWVIILYL